MPHCVCLITGCHDDAVVAASVRVHGVPSPWLLCSDHATMLGLQDLPEWFEVDRLHTVAEIFPAGAAEASQNG